MSHNIDKIIYINLNRRIDRKEEIENELNNFNLNYERFEAIDIPGFGCVGCSKSHLAVLKIAKQNNYKNILILEDDFKFLVSKEEFEKNLTDFFSLNLHFDVCMLSYGLEKWEELHDNNVVNRMLKSLTTSGYIVNNHYYDKLIEIYETSVVLLEQTRAHWLYAADVAYQDYQLTDNWYYFKTRIGKQRPSYSDCGECFMEYLHC